MRLMGHGIYVRFFEVGDAAARLDFYVRNRDFFEQFPMRRRAAAPARMKKGREGCPEPRPALCSA
jgi:hypothetical protein